MDFKARYDQSSALSFLRNDFLPEDFETLRENLTLNGLASPVNKVTQIGRVPSLDLAVYECTHESENDPRVSISKTLFRVMAEYGHSQALIFVHSSSSKNWRLSLATVALNWVEGKRVKKEFSNPKRFSFFLGPQAKVHTPEAALVKSGRVKDLDDLKKRFALEVVNKNFYDGIAKLFTELTGGDREEGAQTRHHAGLLKLPSETHGSLKSKEFAVRLIGRLVFCWFLKKKGSPRGGSLIPDDILSLNAATKPSNYYHTTLEPLFFEVLNKEHPEREKDFQKDPWSLVPFLNGGLFDPHNDDFYERGATGYSKYINTLTIPDAWLKKLIDLFEIYNFTIDENTPVDVELSVDPEMLGRIFENLLAEINPETGESARKASGSYYTPRSVVDYMVEESLMLYIQSKTGLSKEKTKSLFSYTNGPLSLQKEEKTKLIRSLEEIKAVDPACGSGAFPMGILQKIFLLLQNLDPDKSLWLENMLAGVPDDLVREEMRKRLRGETSQYLYKLKLIRDCIFGVDIQPIAVEIAKLRCFLSLIVDEKVEDKKPNRGIEPLPNLEFKFVCANTLIGLPKTESESSAQLLPGMGEDTESINQLRLIRTQFFNSHGKKKEKLESEFKNVQGKMFDFHLKQISGRASKVSWAKIETSRRGNGGETQTGALASWNPFGYEACNWFDPEWMFGVTDGFDIAIANPPYVRQEDIDEDLKKRLAPRKLPKSKGEKTTILIPYECYTGLSDLFVFFYERSVNLLKTGGILTFISSNKYFRSGYGAKLREFLSKRTRIKNIIDFGDAPVFTAIAYPSIIVLAKEEPNGNEASVLNWEPGPRIDDFKEVFQNRSFLIAQKSLTPDGWRLESPSVLRLLDKIRATGKPLGEYINGRFYYGIKTGLNEAFVVDKTTRDRLISEHKSSSAILKPFLRGRDVKRWRVDFSDQYLIKLESSENFSHPWAEKSLKDAEKVFSKTYPAVYEFFQSLKNIKLEEPDKRGCRNMFEKLQRRDDQGKYYWELRSCIYWDEFEEPKVLFSRFVDRPTYAFDQKGFYANNAVWIISRVPPEFVGLLNSRLVWWFLTKHSTDLQNGFLQIFMENLSSLGVPYLGSLSNVVKQYVSQPKNILRRNNIFDADIDHNVFKIYGLTKEEIKIIEGEARGE